MKPCRTLKLVSRAPLPTTQFDNGPINLIESLRRRKTMLSVADLAEMLQMGRRTIYSGIKAGRIPSVRICGTVRIDPVQAAQWLERNSIGAIAS